MSNLCPSYAKCPIYTGILQGKTMTSNAYKQYYCEAGEKGMKNCKRYQVKKTIGTCPAGLLPNSSLSVDEIIEHYQLQR